MLLLICCIAAASSVFPTAEAARSTDLLTALETQGNFSIITYYLNKTHLLSDLMNETAFPEVTLFLPTDEVLNSLPADELTRLNSDPIYLSHVLRFHIADHDAVKLKTQRQDKVFDTMALQPLRLNFYKDLDIYSAEGVEVTRINILLDNGWLHVLGGLMVPPEGNIPYLVSHRPDMRILTSLLHVAGLSDVIRVDENMTLFAPSDDAFGKLDDAAQKYLQSNPDVLKEVLLYHIIDKQTVYSIGMRHSMTFQSADKKHDRVMLMEDGTGNFYLNGGKISEVDISATNGVIHVIDRVMFPLNVILEMEGHDITVIG